MTATLRFMIAIAGVLAVAAPARATDDPVEPIRRYYLEAVDDPRAIDRGLAAVEEVHARGEARPGSVREGLLTAYRGAFVTLRAKHGHWPPARLRHLDQGLELLDAMAVAHPDHAEIRYLRLMSCYYLPGILGRGWSVREDFAALARLLPGARERHPPELYRAIVEFVLANGEIRETDRAVLEATLSADAQRL